ncbi:MAG: gliding motility-associated ABC transporter substrate-binding protein GldG [Dysgonamonadaceae bacterium]|jgi:ABC-2 type transport system permease protein|nr:gliding motility-associated ABC transporter substrate-binding protein GldG [Dysgonamonadaceae bacterium]
MEWKSTYKRLSVLILKEWRSGFYSLSGSLFTALFLLICGCMLWVIPGEYNLLDSGYASLSAFFRLASVLLLFLIPALAMRSFAEEKKTHTWWLLKSRPLGLPVIVGAKMLALFLLVLTAIIPTVIYVFTVYHYGNPIGNIDIGAVIASYLGLLVVIAAFICISGLASALTSNSVVAFIAGLFFCAFFYFGFSLISLPSLGFLSHYQSIQRGLIETNDLFYFLVVGAGFYILTMKVLGAAWRSKAMLWGSGVFLLFGILSCCWNARWDSTKDKKYTVSPKILSLVEKVRSPIKVDIYLTGKLNPGFTRLQQAILLLLNDIQSQSSAEIQYQLTDPYLQSGDFLTELNREGMQGVAVNERLADGKTAQTVLFPYALVQYQDRKLPVSLLVNQPGKSGEENLNTSIELLPYQLAHTLQILTQTEPKRILFTEGHGEFSDQILNSYFDALSYEYIIDRGVIVDAPDSLFDYSLIAVAGPQKPFSEQDKFLLDQYLMQGGRLLWLVNGTQIHSQQELAQSGETIAMSNDLNLNDLFFIYGVRINPVILEDLQCLLIPVVVSDSSHATDYVPKPWYYAPLLEPNNQSAVTKGLSFVKTEFAGTIAFVGDRASKKEILLTSSPYAHSVSVPASINLSETDRKPDKHYFNESHLPVAVALEGRFPSVFNRRTVPLAYSRPILSESKPTKIIVSASDQILSDDGYDQYSQTQFANQAFIVNAVNFLTDNESLSDLKNRSLQLQLLNKNKLGQDYFGVIAGNVVLPPVMILGVAVLLGIWRKRRRRG